MNPEDSQSPDEFGSLLFDLLPLSSQRKLDRIAQLQLQTKSNEPLLKSQDCRIAVAEIEFHQLKVRQLGEQLDLVEEDLQGLLSDLQTLNEVDVKEIEKNLIKISSDVKMYEMKVNEYGNVCVPEIASLREVKLLRKEVDEIKESVNKWKLEGSLYDGIENFRADYLRELVRQKEEQLRKLTEEIATRMEMRRSLV